jgi:cytochrome c-L
MFSKSLILGCLFSVVTTTAVVAEAQMQRFNHTHTGQPLDLNLAKKEGRETDAVKHFMATGENPYNEDSVALPTGEKLFLTMCSGCHGHTAEGKIGPGLNDSYWTYRKNKTDKGLFETIFGGARGQMGPMYRNLNLDEMLHVMAWVRHLYTGDPSSATWLAEEKRQRFTPYSEEGHGGQ